MNEFRVTDMGWLLNGFLINHTRVGALDLKVKGIRLKEMESGTGLIRSLR